MTVGFLYAGVTPFNLWSNEFPQTLQTHARLVIFKSQLFTCVNGNVRHSVSLQCMLGCTRQCSLVYCASNLKNFLIVHTGI